MMLDLPVGFEVGPHWHDILGSQVTQYMWWGARVLVATSIDMNTFHVARTYG